LDSRTEKVRTATSPDVNELEPAIETMKAKLLTAPITAPRAVPDAQ